MLFVKLPVNRRLLVIKFWGSQKLYADCLLYRRVGAPNPALLKG